MNIAVGVRRTLIINRGLRVRSDHQFTPRVKNKRIEPFLEMQEQRADTHACLLPHQMYDSVWELAPHTCA